MTACALLTMLAFGLACAVLASTYWGNDPLKVLFVTARSPWPPLKGDQVRSFNQLKVLGEKHDVTLLTFCSQQELDHHGTPLDGMCQKIIRIPFHWSTGLLIGIWNIVALRWPGQISLYHSPRLMRSLQEHLNLGGYDILHVQLSRMASHIPPTRSIPTVVDFIDALSLNMCRRAAQERFWLAPIFRLEARLMARWEKLVATKVERSVVVSDADGQALDCPESTQVIPNGVDLEKFDFKRTGRRPASIVFSGNMSYFPNVDAACWFAQAVFPRILAARPDVEFVIAGTSPNARVLRLAEENPSIKVTGFIPDMVDTLQKMTLAVAPMRSGTGIQNKVIEAMATGLPVVASSYALGGLEIEPGRELLVENDAEPMADAILNLLADPLRLDALAAAGRAYVVEKHSWGHSVAMLEKVWSEAISSASKANV